MIKKINPYDTVKRMLKGDIEQLIWGGILFVPESGPSVDYYDYVSFKELRDDDQNLELLIGTGVIWNDPDLKFRVKFMWKNHANGGVCVGHPGQNVTSSSSWDYYKSNRFFTYQGRPNFDLDGDPEHQGHRISGSNMVNDQEYDLAFGNNYIYDNINETYIAQSSRIDFEPVQDVEILFDMAHWWIKSLEIRDGQDNILFDGVAAGKDGVFGLYDSIGRSLHYTDQEAEGHNL